VPMHLRERSATLSGVISIEQVEQLAAWLGERARPPAINLRRCTHLHTAVLQALMAARVKISVPPEDSFLRAWVMPALECAAAPVSSTTEVAA
jgi:hypothetical protein